MNTPTATAQEVWYTGESINEGYTYVWGHIPDKDGSLRLVAGPMRTADANLLVSARETLSVLKRCVDDGYLFGSSMVGVARDAIAKAEGAQ